MRLTASTVIMMLVFLGEEPVEGDNTESDNRELLDATLDSFELSLEQFTTEENGFNIGYTRGLASSTYDEEQCPVDGEGNPNNEFMLAIDEGYSFALEARDMKCPPPASLVYAAWKAGDIEGGALAAWAAQQDLSEGHRLAVAVTAGSGKNAVTIPAGTPVELLSETERDGVKTYVVLVDGAALLVPAPEDSPEPLVSADTEVARAKKARKAGASKGGTRKASSAERGPSLKDAFIYVVEGQDGGPGPLQDNAAFALAVKRRCTELGIGDKARTFVQKCDKHVPYYMNGYKPLTDKNTGAVTGKNRSSSDEPKVWVVAAIEARKYYLRAEGDHEARLAAIPEELRARVTGDRDLVIEVPKSES